MQRMSAKRDVARGLRHLQPDSRLKPLSIIADQRDQCDWRFANVCRQCSEIIQSLLRRRIEDVILPERVEATGLIGSRERWNHNLESSGTTCDWGLSWN